MCSPALLMAEGVMQATFATWAAKDLPARIVQRPTKRDYTSGNS